MKKNFTKFIWLLGFLPAIVGAILIAHIYSNMTAWISMITDIFFMIIIGIISCGLTAVSIPLLILLSRKLCNKYDQGLNKLDDSSDTIEYKS